MSWIMSDYPECPECFDLLVLDLPPPLHISNIDWKRAIILEKKSTPISRHWVGFDRMYSNQLIYTLSVDGFRCSVKMADKVISVKICV